MFNKLFYNQENIVMDKRRGSVYGLPPIKEYRDKPQPTVYEPPPVKEVA